MQTTNPDHKQQHAPGALYQSAASLRPTCAETEPAVSR